MLVDSTANSHRPDIDGLRAIAVLGVVAFHAFPDWLPGGYAGVDVFFVISGFLISRIVEQGVAAGTFSFADFYSRRIRRIFPALIVVLAACLGFGWFALFAYEYKPLGRHVAAGAAFVSNFALWSEIGYFDRAAGLKPLLHLWSLAIEEQFYIAWPLLLWLAHQARLRLALANALLGVGSLLLCVLLAAQDSPGAFYSPLARMWELQLGAALAFTPDLRQRALPVTSGALGLALIAAAFLGAGAGRGGLIPLAGALLASAGACIIIAAGPQGWVHRALLANRPMVWTGVISYPLYLWHWPMLVMARIVEGDTPAPPITGATVVLAALFAALTWRLLERPIRSARHSRSQRIGSAAVLTTLMAGIGIAGWVTDRHDGWSDRPAYAGIARYKAFERPGVARESDGSCAARLGFQPLTEQVCLTNSAAPKTLVFGDSHAMALYAGLYIGAVTEPALLMAAHGCLPFEHYASVEPHEKLEIKNCTGVTRATLTALDKLPSIKTVWLVTRGPLYFSGRGFGNEGLTGMRIFRPGQAELPDQPQAFFDGYAKIAARLIASGRRVVFVIDVPELGVDPRNCVAQPPLTFTQRVPARCDHPRHIVLERQRQYRELVARIAAANPALRVVDSLDTFCDAATCYAMDARESFYWDDDHLSVAGSTKLLNALLADPPAQ